MIRRAQTGPLLLPIYQNDNNGGRVEVIESSEQKDDQDQRVGRPLPRTKNKMKFPLRRPLYLNCAPLHAHTLCSDHLKFMVQASLRLSSRPSLGCAGRLNSQSHRTPPCRSISSLLVSISPSTVVFYPPLVSFLTPWQHPAEVSNKSVNLDGRPSNLALDAFTHTNARSSSPTLVTSSRRVNMDAAG